MRILRFIGFRAALLNWVGSLAFSHHLLAQTKGPARLRLNQSWWNQTDTGEREGFVSGFLDCRQIPNAATASYADYITFVDNHVKENINSVPETIETAAHALKSRNDPGAENWPGPHGFLNGGYWGSGSKKLEAAWETMHRGYVEGYLACRRLPVTISSVDHCVRLINNHYLDPNHENDFIADVLNPLLPPDKSEQAR